jgi:hypothetical protein
VGVLLIDFCQTARAIVNDKDGFNFSPRAYSCKKSIYSAAENLDGTYLNSNFGFDYVKLYEKLLKIWLMQKVIKEISLTNSTKGK